MTEENGRGGDNNEPLRQFRSEHTDRSINANFFKEIFYAVRCAAFFGKIDDEKFLLQLLPMPARKIDTA